MRLSLNRSLQQLMKPIFETCLLILLFQVVLGQTATLKNQRFQTLDRLGFISNQASVNFNPYPQSVYQIMTQNPNGTISVKIRIDNLNKLNSLYCFPSIILPKMMRRVGFRSKHQLNITVNYISAVPPPQSISIVDHLFSVNLDLGDQITLGSYRHISFFMMRYGRFLKGVKQVNINGTPMMQIATNVNYYFQNISNSSFSGVIDLDAIVDYAIKNNYINSNSVIQQVRISSQNFQGIFDLSISYEMIYDTLVYLQPGSAGIAAGFNWFVQINYPNLTLAQYLEVQTPKIPIKLSDIQFVCKTLPTSTTYKGSFQIRVGYYKSWVTPFETYRFPLDPKQTTSFFVQVSYHYTNQPTNKLLICWILRVRSDFNSNSKEFTNTATSAQKQIHICPLANPSAQLIVLQQFVVFDTLNNKYLFRYSQTSDTQPVFTFWTTAGAIAGGLDLFQFVTKLVNINKFGPNDLISGLSFAFKVNTYSGSFFISSFNLACASNQYLSGGLSPQCINCDKISGCLFCSSSKLCLACSKDWYLKNGSCQCAEGFMQLDTGTSRKCISNIKLQTSLSCILMEEGQTLETCLNSSSLKLSIILNLVSVPNMALILRVSQIFAFIDDFTYYIYHNMHYGDRFDQFLKFVWNLTNQRFIPYSIAGFYYGIQDQYDKQIRETHRENIPKGWDNLSEGATFLGNTRDFWLSLLPLNTLVFLFFNFLYKILRYYKSSYADKLNAFKWISIFVFSLLSQNIQFISFRSFQQIIYGGPSSFQPSLIAYSLNYVVCYIVLFIFVLFACCGVKILRYMLKNNISEGMEFIKYSQPTIWFYGITQLVRVFNGFIHACFYNNNYVQFILLCLGQLIILISIIGLRKKFKQKSFFAFITTQYLFRVILHLYLFMRVYFKFVGKLLTDRGDNQLDDTVLTIVFSIMFLSIFQCFVQMAFSYQLEKQPKSKIQYPNKSLQSNSFKTNQLKTNSTALKKISQVKDGVETIVNSKVFRDTTQILQKMTLELNNFLQEPSLQVEKKLSIKKERYHRTENRLIYNNAKKKYKTEKQSRS